MTKQIERVGRSFPSPRFQQTLESHLFYARITDEVEEFCDELINSHRQFTSTVVMDDDFTAKFGREGKDCEKYIGKYDMSKRNGKDGSK